MFLAEEQDSRAVHGGVPRAKLANLGISFRPKSFDMESIECLWNRPKIAISTVLRASKASNASDPEFLQNGDALSGGNCVEKIRPCTSFEAATAMGPKLCEEQPSTPRSECSGRRPL